MLPASTLTLKERKGKDPHLLLSLWDWGKNEKSSPMSLTPYSPNMRKEGPMSLEEPPAVSLSLQKREQSGVKEQLWVTERR